MFAFEKGVFALEKGVFAHLLAPLDCRLHRLLDLLHGVVGLLLLNREFGALLGGRLLQLVHLNKKQSRNTG